MMENLHCKLIVREYNKNYLYQATYLKLLLDLSLSCQIFNALDKVDLLSE